ncbi:glucokinase [Bradyrhizobium sp. YCK136]|jgi:glucokinase|uniref:Glucokinase n=1 Tax=Bradyrhizobium diazoefficiens TaxID=1355477 RepID=A0A0E4BWV7_9BRAD|nr:glucokinase [Bradyrhizobium diazoefficiens]MBP1092610.1 glucokinase [Bradyrhizobium japonicum]MBR0867066.1 glucokinase [Bradyrhizobium diazoefficiens]MBR0891569.1 glucokinase [Bradyrhizobium diazoefficiens]MBR0923317.1 glucokinase [Bradyrhizobium diazoefficiens]WLA60972.1 glucokinase [Bradyrhizobium diazoefficiens]
MIKATLEGRAALLADVGGTNARFALLTDGELGAITHMAVKDHATSQEALAAYLGASARAERPAHAILAASGAVQNGRCALTNNSWIVDAEELRGAYGFSAVRLINDFEAVAWALPRLGPDSLLQLGGRQQVPGAPLAAIGPGTGLGMAVSIPHPGGQIVLASEGGHATLAGGSLREDAVIEHLRQRFGHVSAERILSGAGLENLYDALACIDGATPPKRRASDITRAGIEGTCPISRSAVDMFCAMLGSVAGNLALALNARGGIFIGGGILRHLPDYLAASQFRQRFEEKGRLRKFLEPIPAYLILDDDVAFVGLRNLMEVEGIG